jgi:hypothetical protein
MAAGLEELVDEYAFEPGIRRIHRWTIVSHRDDPTRQGASLMPIRSSRKSHKNRRR